ncbi:hypothetical protein [Paenibacillus silviterrae]|nr:hypothetical protein [Paenibacillus chinjuensis]
MGPIASSISESWNFSWNWVTMAADKTTLVINTCELLLLASE